MDEDAAQAGAADELDDDELEVHDLDDADADEIDKEAPVSDDGGLEVAPTSKSAELQKTAVSKLAQHDPDVVTPRVVGEVSDEVSYADLVLARKPVWALMGLHGLDAFEKAFEPSKVPMADLQLAKARADLMSCTKMRVNPDADAGPLGVSHMHSPVVSLERLTCLPKRGHRKGEYGLPVSINLYLRFNLEFALLLLACFALSYPRITDHLGRSELRNQCTRWRAT